MEDTHYVEWKDEEYAADGDEAAVQKVSSHLHIEPIAYVDEDDEENEPIAAKKSAKRPRKPYTRRTYKVEDVVDENSGGPYNELDGGDDHHNHDDVDEINETVAVPRIKHEYNAKLPTTVAAVVPKKSTPGRKPRGQKSEPKAAKLPKMEQCEVCGFISRSLKTHMLTHTNEKRYECDFCGKKFALRSSMKNHLFAHVNIR